ARRGGAEEGVVTTDDATARRGGADDRREDKRGFETGSSLERMKSFASFMNGWTVNGLDRTQGA
ncbi:MAG: hypothetical protein U1A16_01830, partial [Patescibacteria group bacterium]|nr:hypothetical protein [Patescibacteria group bacterium]